MPAVKAVAAGSPACRQIPSVATSVQLSEVNQAETGNVKIINSAIYAVAILGALTAQAQADGYPAVPLLSTSKTVMDEEIAYPANGPAKINAMLVTILPGEKTVAHQHGVPLFVYVLEGEVTVDYGEHGKKVFTQGQTFMEAMAIEHVGTNVTSSPVKLLAVYLSAEGAKDVIPRQ